MNREISPDKILRLRTVLERTGLSRSTVIGKCRKAPCPPKFAEGFENPLNKLRLTGVLSIGGFEDAGSGVFGLIDVFAGYCWLRLRLLGVKLSGIARVRAASCTD